MSTRNFAENQMPQTQQGVNSEVDVNKTRSRSHRAFAEFALNTKLNRDGFAVVCKTTVSPFVVFGSLAD